jgi:methyl coenzyme M reductase gamma subunit
MSVNVEPAVEVDHRDHQFLVVVNAVQHTVEAERLTYEQVVKLAYPQPPAPGVRFTVTFRKAKEPHEGSLAPGQAVEVKKSGTVFNVTPTSKS